MNDQISVETSIKAAIIFGYILIVASMFIVLLGANVGYPPDLPVSEYQEFVISNSKHSPS